MKYKVAAFFDLDNTIIDSSIEREFGYYLYINHKIKAKHYFNMVISSFKYKLNIIKDKKELQKIIVYNLVKDIEPETIEKCFKDFFEVKLYNKIYPEFYRLVRKYKNKGIRIYIVSSVLSVIVKEFAELICADGYFGTELKQRDNKYTGDYKTDITCGREKAEKMKDLAEKEGIDLEKSYAFGDYFHDLYMLELVGIPIVVNPDKELKDLAIKRNWRIENWLLN